MFPFYYVPRKNLLPFIDDVKLSLAAPFLGFVRTARHEIFPPGSSSSPIVALLRFLARPRYLRVEMVEQVSYP